MKGNGPARDEADREKEDRLLVYGVSDGGRTAHVVRRRGEDVETGVLRPPESGKPLTGDLVSLKRRPEFPLLFDVSVEVPSPLRPRARELGAGPARVSSDAYRRGWDTIWGRASGEAPPEDDEPLPH